MDIKTAIGKLITSRLMKTKQEFRNFEMAIGFLKENDFKSFIPENVCAFDDKTEEFEAMYDLVHLIEKVDNIDDKEYFNHIIKSFKYMIPNAEEWAEILIGRILKYKSGLKLFISTLNHAEKNDQEIVISFVEKLKSDSSYQYKEAADLILKSSSNN